MAKKTELGKWMTAKGLKDIDLSIMTGVSRVHISRIRRRKSGANKALALRLQTLTGISWHHFIEPTLPNRSPKSIKRLKMLRR